MMATIPQILIDHILAEAAASPDREVCGLLLGTDRRVQRIVPTGNVAADPSRAFEIDPAALFAALRAERRGGAGVIGHYHSHPNGRAEPSPCDLAAAEPGKIWIIIGNGVARAWLAERNGFRELELVNDS
ncbi:M67 family metallopeptidase [Sphingomonas sp. MMS24-J13]|uniref:M67 family metallopeptidase n=1 Tax=Sphingomonas sp. MMS24-J13 TaxID=3238686 RepID=UPI00384DC3CB